MDFIEKLCINHVVASHGIVVVLAVAIARIDALIAFVLRIFSKEQVEAAIDKAAGAAKAEVDKVSQQQPKP